MRKYAPIFESRQSLKGKKGTKNSIILALFNGKHYICTEINVFESVKERLKYTDDTYQAMDKEKQNRGYFVSFCIEQYKKKNHLTGAEAMQQLDQYKVLDYLDKHFEVLHTQSSQWVLEDIEEFIRLRKEEMK